LHVATKTRLEREKMKLNIKLKNGVCVTVAWHSQMLDTLERIDEDVSEITALSLVDDTIEWEWCDYRNRYCYCEDNSKVWSDDDPNSVAAVVKELETRRRELRNKQMHEEHGDEIEAGATAIQAKYPWLKKH